MKQPQFLLCMYLSIEAFIHQYFFEQAKAWGSVDFIKKDYFLMCNTTNIIHQE